MTGVEVSQLPPPTPFDALKITTLASLGLWLLSNRRPNLAHYVAIAAFAILTIIAGLSWFRGDLACDCFGPLKVTPSVTTIMDILVLLCLFRFRPQRSAAISEVVLGKTARKVLAFAGLFFVGIFVRQYLADANVAVTIAPDRVVLPSGRPSTNAEATVRVVNASDVPVTLVGGGASCSCLTLADFPVTVPARGGRDLVVRFTRPSRTGQVHHEIRYYLDHPSQYFVSATVTGQVADDSP